MDMTEETTEETEEEVEDARAEVDVLDKFLMYTGPSAVFVFDGVRFLPGIPVLANLSLAERLLVHPLAAEGHRLTIVE